MSRKVWMAAGAALLFVAVAVTLYEVITPHFQPLPVYMSLPDVTLVDQAGQSFDLSQTRGKVVVLTIIYTHCPDVCPLTTAKMRQVQQRIQGAGLSDQVEFISITVDPQRDTPDVLKHFADAYHADYSNWAFLSGTTDQTNLVVADLKAYVEQVYMVNGNLVPKRLVTPVPSPDTPYFVNHTDRLYLADQQGRVRALPPGSRSDVNDVTQTVRQLVAEGKVPNG
jgi:protein SCO1/2